MCIKLYFRMNYNVFGKEKNMESNTRIWRSIVKYQPWLSYLDGMQNHLVYGHLLVGRFSFIHALEVWSLGVVIDKLGGDLPCICSMCHYDIVIYN